MEFHSSQITKGDAVPSQQCSVKANSRLVEVFQRTANGGSPYLFVEDASGRPVGLLAAEDILRRVTDPNPGEFMKWMDMPAEAALQSRIDIPGVSTSHHNAPSEVHTQVSRNGVLLGLITDDDVLVSWRSIQKTLRASQGDGVTGLPNRSTFDQHLKAEINRANRGAQSIGVILIDLDHFKRINDKFGHAAGDNALVQVGNRLRSSLRSYDMVARFGGDEFAVICSGCRPGEIDIVVRRLRENILELRDSTPPDLPLPGISVGAVVAHDPCDVHNADQLIATADEALYFAKNAGRNCAYKKEIGKGISANYVFVEDRYSHSDSTDNMPDTLKRCRSDAR